MKPGLPGSFGVQLKALREAAGFTQEELATIAGLSVHAVSALERGERRRPHVETIRALSAALDLTGSTRDALLASARAPVQAGALDDLSRATLPIPPTTLLGRDADMEELRRWLDNPAARLITLTGPGGVGKTRLALELARSIAEEGSFRVLFVPLAAIDTVGLAGCAIADALGLAAVTGFELPARARAACDGRPTMIVLDNFEQVLAAAPLIVELLTSVTVLRLVVTSRAPLRVRGERQYAVEPLALAADSEAASPADLARAPAVRLFVERIRDVQRDFRLTTDNGPTVTAICRRLDGLPLALEIAAPWIKVLTAETLLQRLEDDAGVLTVGHRDLPERQQTMNATVAWSYRLLDADEQRAFRRFGALPGLFPIDAADAVLAGRDGATDSNLAIRVTAGLIDKSLLVRAEQPEGQSQSTFYMLETVRACAIRELSSSSEGDDAIEGLVRYCTVTASAAKEGLAGPSQVDWLNRVRVDLESYRAALPWLIARGRAAESCDIAWGLMFFWLIRGYAAEGLWWYEATLKIPSLPSATESRARLGAALMRYARGEHELARTEVTTVLALSDPASDSDVVAQAHHLLGHLEYALGNMEIARDSFARSADLFRSVANPWGRGQALSGMAAVALAVGDGDDAERLLDEAAPALQGAGPWFMSLASYVRTVLALRRRDVDDALALVRENLTRSRTLRDRFAFVYTLIPLAAAAVLTGEDAWAARVLGLRDTLIERTGIRLVDSRVLDLQDQAEQEARGRIGAERWTQARAIGRHMSIDALLKDLDRVITARAAST